MSEKRIIEHYVPQCYLCHWGYQKKNQTYVYVYDKESRKSYPTNIKNIASERFFYDIDFSKILSDEKKQQIFDEGIDINKLDDGQYIEHFLSEKVEGRFSAILKEKIDRIASMNAWEIKNCFAFSESEKADFSFHLALLMIRVKAMRRLLLETSNSIQSMLTDMGATEQNINKYRIDESILPLIQAQMITDFEKISQFAIYYNNLTWVLLINKTNIPFFTSDNPISRIAHKYHYMIPLSGLDSKGIEVYLPLSPNVLLLMYDGAYHNYAVGTDRSIGVLDNTKFIRYYNHNTVMQSEKWIISPNNDFSHIKEILTKDPKALDPQNWIVRG